MHPDQKREILPGKTLEYAEASVPRWLLAGGALPLLIPAGERASAYARDLDALVLQGGADIAPECYGETALHPDWQGDPIRDRYELDLLRAFLDQGKPVLGICRGCQLINVALGGTLYQDIATQIPRFRLHRDAAKYDRHQHRVHILPQSRLARLYPEQEFGRINSIHHQAIKDLGKGLVVEAVSQPDEVIEAVRLRGSHYVQGIQWHPEFVTAQHRSLLPSSPLLETFLRAVERDLRTR
jgi:putative glutamine amidotransferase